MKDFSVYQYVGGPMTERDAQEVNSKFWNKGKWDNFIAPFLPRNCRELSLVDMGCNAGLFLKLAEDRGFDRVIGIDADKGAIERAIKYREENGGKYDIQRRRVERSLKHLPVVDFTVLANVHYYIELADWLEYVHQLEYKTRYCVIVSGRKRPYNQLAGSSLTEVRDYFKDWREVNVVSHIAKEGDPSPRDLFSVCFESPIITRESIDGLDNGNRQQRDFYQQLDNGVPLVKTDYYRRMKSYRLKEHNWSKEELDKEMEKRVVLYEDMKKRGLMRPIIVNSKNRIFDGNHRCEIMKHFGYQTILVRRIL